jgi:hypothetical protein
LSRVILQGRQKKATVRSKHNNSHFFSRSKKYIHIERGQIIIFKPYQDNSITCTVHGRGRRERRTKATIGMVHSVRPSAYGPTNPPISQPYSTLWPDFRQLRVRSPRPRRSTIDRGKPSSRADRGRISRSASPWEELDRSLSAPFSSAFSGRRDDHPSMSNAGRDKKSNAARTFEGVGPSPERGGVFLRL